MKERKPNKQFDPVNAPQHYTQGNIECIDAMEAAYGTAAVDAFCLCNAFKYQWRAPFKGHMEEDLRKAAWYNNKHLELQKKLEAMRDSCEAVEKE